MNATYYFFYLETALAKGDDLNIYAFINVSHIPTSKLIEIFEIDLKTDPYISDGYFLTRDMHKRYIYYLKQNVGILNFEIFEYTLRQYEAKDFKEIRKLYKESFME